MPTGIYKRSAEQKEKCRRLLLGYNKSGIAGFQKGNQLGRGRVKGLEEIKKIKKALTGKKKPIGFSEKCRQRELLKNKLGRSNSLFVKGHQIMLGDKHWNWKGGVTKDSAGYIKIRVSKGNYKLEHRANMEDYLGRKLNKNEHVHHINGNKKDNRIANLKLMSNSEHIRSHYENRK